MKVTVEIDAAPSRKPAEAVAGFASFPPVTLRLPPDIQAELERRALESGRSRNAEALIIFATAFDMQLPNYRTWRSSRQMTNPAGATHAQ